MKARLPYRYNNTSRGKRQQAVAAALMLFARALSDYGMSANKINEWVALVLEATNEVAGTVGNCFANKTWQDELAYWGEQHGFDFPKEYKLYIRGVAPAGGEQMFLLLLELYALTKMGYGELRLKKILAKYAEISDLYGGGVSKYTRIQLEEWCGEKGVCLC